MDEEDFIALVGVVEREFIAMGAAELANPNLYTVVNSETGEQELMKPQQRLLEMLSTFQRHMKVRDNGLYHSALAEINKNLSEGRVRSAVFAPLHDAAVDSTIQLADAPELSGLSGDLANLIGQLKESYRPRGLTR